MQENNIMKRLYPMNRSFFLLRYSRMMLFFVMMLIAGCAGNPRTGTVTDIDGNSYETARIGSHVWMTENLKVTRYRNGDPVQEVQDATEWSTLTVGARCSYDNNPENGKTMGMLYNGHAVSDPRGLAPAGWHVATDEEWSDLVEACGGESEAGKALKVAGKWEAQSVKAGERNGFDVLPAGARRDSDGQFVLCGQFARFWTATPASNGKTWGRAMEYYDDAVHRGEVGPRNGFAVRCVKD
jgi:uncharacterized protein (TIGR02145 family)